MSTSRELVPHLPRLARIALRFPKWTDGRAYSQARLLRVRHRFAGELRAIGDVIPDMAAQLHRTGFDVAVLRAGESIEVAQRDARPDSGVLSGGCPRAAPALRSRRRAIGAGMTAAPSPRVVFVGAGPGQADLITLRGAQRLQSADIVLFDSLADPALRELAPDACWIDVGKRGFAGVPHAPRGARENTGQDTINALLVRHAQSGARVVRLKGGDPSVFGRLEEELEALARRASSAKSSPASPPRSPPRRRRSGR